MIETKIVILADNVEQLDEWIRKNIILVTPKTKSNSLLGITAREIHRIGNSNEWINVETELILRFAIGGDKK